ncbi:MAG: DUF1826 domain-containing protein [Methylibium sp.]|nr:DUF1826 domain-containing protein [Methylibium sp.]
MKTKRTAPPATGRDGALRLPAAAEPPTVPAVETDHDPGVLERVSDPAIELALWQRQLPADLAAWLEALPAALLPVARFDVTPAGAGAALRAACDASGTPRGGQRDALIEDICALVARFARIAGSASVRLRLQAVGDDACRRWHRDCVPLRLLSTYRGPATQWLEPARGALALARPDEDVDAPFFMSPHAVGLFKGCGFIEHTHESGIVHRSPRIAGTGVTRLVLCLNSAPAGMLEVPG